MSLLWFQIMGTKSRAVALRPMTLTNEEAAELLLACNTVAAPPIRMPLALPPADPSILRRIR